MHFINSKYDLFWLRRQLRSTFDYGALGCDYAMPATESFRTLRLHSDVEIRHGVRPSKLRDVNIPLMTDARTGFFAC